MPTAKSPLRLDAEITASAAEAAARMSRSLSEQVSHWARLGRELERGPGVSLAEIEAVLDGRVEYDALPAREQAVVRTAWIERMAGLRAALRMDDVHGVAGQAYAELGADGQVVVREPEAEARPAARRRARARGR